MKSLREVLDTRISRAVGEIPPERPDLLIAASNKRYKIAAASGIFALANAIAATRNYAPAEIQTEVHIANYVAASAGVAAGLWNGLTGFYHRYIVDEVSFTALDQQLQSQDEPRIDRPEPPEPLS